MLRGAAEPKLRASPAAPPVVKRPGSGIVLREGSHRGYFVRHYAPASVYTLPGTLASLAQEKMRP